MGALIIWSKKDDGNRSDRAAGKNSPEGTLHKEGAPPAAFDVLIIAV